MRRTPLNNRFSYRCARGALWAIVVSLAGCSGLISLDLPASDQLDPERDWLTLGRNLERQHYSPVNLAPPLNEVWHKGVKSVVTDHPLAVGDFILAPTRSGMLYVVHAPDGAGVGNGKIGPAMSSLPTISGGDMYAGFNIGNETLMAFSLRNSKRFLNRRYPTITTAPLVWQNKVYFGTAEGLFICANARTGEKIWEYDAGAPLHSSPALREPAIVFGDDKGHLYALEVTSGVELWTTQLDGGTFSHPVLDDSTVYMGTVTGTLHARRLSDGAERWRGSFGGAIYSSPALYQNTLYLGTNGREVLALRTRDGSVVWRLKTGGIVNTVPLPSPDYVYVTAWDKYLYVLDRFTGETLQKIRLRKPAKSSPILFRDHLIVHTANDRLVAFGASQPQHAREDQGK